MCELGSLGEVKVFVDGRLPVHPCGCTKFTCADDIKAIAQCPNCTLKVPPTGFLDVDAVFCVAGFWAVTHQVDGKDSKEILIPHDEVGHNAVGSAVLIEDCEPFLQRCYMNK